MNFSITNFRQEMNMISSYAYRVGTKRVDFQQQIGLVLTNSEIPSAGDAANRDQPGSVNCY